MTQVVLDTLVARCAALIASTTAPTAAPLEQAVVDFDAALVAVRAVQSWDSALIAPLRTALAEAEAARVQFAYLLDRNRRRIDTLANAAGVVHRPAYGRPARLG